MNLLAYDLGNRYGWAHLDGNEITHGHAAAKSALHFFETADDVIFTLRPDAVLFENAGFQRGIPGRKWNDKRAALEMACDRNEVMCHGVAVSTIKKHVTGSGRACKNEVIAAVQNRGYEVADDNEADALALLLYAIDTNLVEVGE